MKELRRPAITFLLLAMALVTLLGGSQPVKLAEAQQAAAPFYISKENPQDCIGKILLGMEKMEPEAKYIRTYF